MQNNSQLYPPIYKRIYSVWFRHLRVYSKNLISNGFPPFLEPIIFLTAIGLGFSNIILEMNGLPYIKFLASGLLITTAMFTASFECTYGTFIRLEFDKIYDGMISSPISVSDLIIGEILWAGTKGIFFSSAVFLVFSIMGIFSPFLFFAVPFAGLLAGLIFGSIGLFVTSFVKDINQFNFYFTGFISPMFFFSGVVFSLKNLPGFLQIFAEVLPLTHIVRFIRGMLFHYSPKLIALDLLYIFIVIFLFSAFAIKRLGKRLIN
ncbi:ABC transporter permease [Candidatus Margulisiibacteriota bacterium]